MVSEPFVVNFHQQNVSLMLLRLLERVPIYNFKVHIIFPSNIATKGQKMHVVTQKLRWMRFTNFLVDFSFNDLKLDIYGRYRDDTFIICNMV